MIEHPKIAFVSPALAVGTWSNVFIMYVYGRVSTADVEAANVTHRALITTCPGGTGVLAVCDADTPIPAGDVRELSAALMRQTAPDVLASSMVVQGGGFWASAARSFVATLLFIAKHPYPTKAFASVESAAEWLGPRAGQIPSQTCAAALEVMVRARGELVHVGP